jgi:hypothetical protein
MTTPRQRSSAAFGFVLALVAATASLAQPTGYRALAFAYGIPIADRLRPDDVAVEMILASAGPLSGDGLPDPETDELAYWTRQADVVAVLRVERRDAHLTPRGDWIMTTVTLRVVEALKDTLGGRAAPDAVITVEEPGGVLIIGGVRVVATMADTAPKVVGRDYLAFLRRVDDEALYAVSPRSTFETTDAMTFSRVGPDAYRRTLTRAEALAAIRVGGR